MPLWDAAALGPAAFPTNGAFVRQHVTQLLVGCFPNMAPEVRHPIGAIGAPSHRCHRGAIPSVPSVPSHRCHRCHRCHPIDAIGADHRHRRCREKAWEKSQRCMRLIG